MAGIGRLAKKISILVSSLSLEGSWRIVGGTLVSRVASLFVSTSFSPVLGYSANFGGLLGRGGTSWGFFSSESATLGGASILELPEEGARMAGG